MPLLIFRNIDLTKKLSVKVLTKKNKFLGKIRINLDILANEPNQDNWLLLMDKKGAPNPKISGEIHISLEYRGPKSCKANDEHIPPDPLENNKMKHKAPLSCPNPRKAEQQENPQLEKDRRELLGNKYREPLNFQAGKEENEDLPVVEYTYDENSLEHM
jgi:hypothetical protein